MLSILELRELGFHENENVLKMECLSALSWLDLYLKYKIDETFFDKPVAEVSYKVVQDCKGRIAEMLAKNTNFTDKGVIIDLIDTIAEDKIVIKESEFVSLLNKIKTTLIDTVKPLETASGDFASYKIDLVFVLKSIFPNTKNLYATSENYNLIKDISVWYRLDENDLVPVTLVEEELKYTERKLKEILR